MRHANEQPALCQVVRDGEQALRLDVERVTLEFRQKSTRRLDTGRQPITESPLFGGNAQEELF